jgi:hypothetical protein
MAAVSQAVGPTRKPLTSFTIESIVGRTSPSPPPCRTPTTQVETETAHDVEICSTSPIVNDKIAPPPVTATSNHFVPAVAVGFNGLSTADSVLTAALLRAGGPGFHCRPPTSHVVISPDGGAGINLCSRLLAASGRIHGVNGGANGLWSPGVTSANGANDVARRAAVAAAAAAAMYSPGAWQSLQTAANRVCAEYIHHPFVGK